MTRKSITKYILLFLVFIILLVFMFMVFRPFSKNILKEKVEFYYDNNLQFPSATAPPGWSVIEQRDNHDLILCKFDILNPLVVLYFTESSGEYLSARFFYLERESFLQQSWVDIEVIGTTTVNNTTFSELQSMLQQDCSQFQKANFKDYNEYRQKLDNGEIVWGFREAEPVEQPPTLEEQYPDSESRQARIQEIEEILLEGEQYLQEFEEIIQNSQDPEEIESFKLNKEQVKESIKEYEAELEQLKGRE